MPNDANKLFLFEAIELRAEYDARVKIVRSVLPETRENRERRAFVHDDDVKYSPAPSFDVRATREELGSLMKRRRVLNAAIQRANFDHRIEVEGQELSLAEALELRKGVNEEIGELATEATKAAYQRVVYKEERDIVEPPDRDYAEVRSALEAKRRSFRELNRKLRSAAYEIVVEYRDDT